MPINPFLQYQSSQKLPFFNPFFSKTSTRLALYPLLFRHRIQQHLWLYTQKGQVRNSSGLVWAECSTPYLLNYPRYKAGVSLTFLLFQWRSSSWQERLVAFISRCMIFLPSLFFWFVCNCWFMVCHFSSCSRASCFFYIKTFPLKTRGGFF